MTRPPSRRFPVLILEIRMREVPAGVLPVLATPFTENGEFDAAALAGEIDFVIEQGAHGVALGMVSEVLRLSSEERDALAEAACRTVDGRVGVITSVGAESLHTAVRYARHAEAVGAVAVMAIPPLGTICDDRQLYAYYAGIIESIDIAVVVQDASGYLGRPLSIELQARLYEQYGHRALFKPEAHPIGPRLTQLLTATGGEARIYEGTGGVALVDSYQRGVVGTMPGPDLVWAIEALWTALKAGNLTRVEEIQGPLSAILCMQNSLDSFIAVQKHLLHRQGVLPNAEPRGPVGYRLDDHAKREVDRLFDRLTAAVAVGREP
jgi:dihydrodipicolinate synthase/N-acetylneuraminate lyase